MILAAIGYAFMITKANIFKWLRSFITKKFGIDSFWYDLISCPSCASVWIITILFVIDKYINLILIYKIGLVYLCVYLLDLIIKKLK